MLLVPRLTRKQRKSITAALMARCDVSAVCVLRRKKFKMKQLFVNQNLRQK